MGECSVYCSCNHLIVTSNKVTTGPSVRYLIARAIGFLIGKHSTLELVLNTLHDICVRHLIVIVRFNAVVYFTCLPA